MGWVWLDFGGLRGAGCVGLSWAELDWAGFGWFGWGVVGGQGWPVPQHAVELCDCYVIAI